MRTPSRSNSTVPCPEIFCKLCSALARLRRLFISFGSFSPVLFFGRRCPLDEIRERRASAHRERIMFLAEECPIENRVYTTTGSDSMRAYKSRAKSSTSKMYLTRLEVSMNFYSDGK